MVKIDVTEAEILWLVVSKALKSVQLESVIPRYLPPPSNISTTLKTQLFPSLAQALKIEALSLHFRVLKWSDHNIDGILIKIFVI